MKVAIKTYENGKKIQFEFSDVEKSGVYNSKEEACAAAADLFMKNEVNAKEFAELVANIMQVKNLPYDGSIEKSIIVSLSMVGGLAVSGGMHFLDKARETFNSGISSVFNVFNKPRFEMCECGCLKGKIFHKGGITNPIENKKKAIFILEALKTSELITDVEHNEIKDQINESKLPD